LERAWTQNRHPLLLVALLGGSSSPPERLVDFVGDIGGGQADVVQLPDQWESSRRIT